MDESKKINAGKYRNKQRHKDKAKAHRKDTQSKEGKQNKSDTAVDEVDTLQKRKLESNWYRYEPKEESINDTSKDFSILASAPLSQASYFQFKSDRNFTNVDHTKQIENELFRLDVDLLNLSLSTIAFHVRCGIPKSYFSEKHINCFCKEATDNVIKYEQYLEINREQIVSDKLAETGDKLLIKEEHKEIENIIALVQTTNISNESENNDLEQWLEDILDD